ncbi:putative cell adhesion molecule, partial [Ixodes scapularis]
PSAKPVDLKVIPLNSTSLRATWKAPSGESKIAGYYVGYKVELDGRSESYVYKTVESRPGVSQECDLKDLRPGTKYTVLVQAYNGKGPGPSSNEVIGETPSSEPPSPPSNVHVTHLASRTVSLRWTPPFDGNSPISQYDLKVHSSRDGTSLVIPVPGTQLEMTLDSLSPNSAYRVEVEAVNSIGTGAPSEPLFFTTDTE